MDVPLTTELRQYSSRDLSHSKYYRYAKKTFDETNVRSRNTVAKEAPEKGDLWSCDFRYDVDQIPIRAVDPSCEDFVSYRNSTCAMNSNCSVRKAKSTDEVNQSEERDKKSREYKDWIAKRKKLRSDISSIGLSEGYLARKPELTPIEAKLLKQMRESREKKKREKSAKKEVQKTVSMSQEEIEERRRRRCTKALHIIDRHIKMKRLRLLDLFKAIDKDKSWTVTKDEFKLAIERAGIALPGPVMDDLIIALDKNNKNELDYRELAKALGEWKVTYKREVRKKLDLGADEDIPGLVRRQGILIHCDEMKKESATVFDQFRLINQLASRRNTQAVLPQIPRYLINGGKKSPSDKEKKTKKKKPAEIIKAIADHRRPSTITDEGVAEQVNSFRQKQLAIYEKIVELCKEKDMQLTQSLLQKALLHPADRSHNYIKNKKQIRQPAGPLLSCRFARPKSRPLTPDDTYKRSVSGKLLMDERKFYPPEATVEPVFTAVDLPTGRAYVSRKVDCWLTFEEYCKLTDDRARYRDVSGVNQDAFWPGDLLDKIRLYLEDDTRDKAHGLHTAFETVKSTPKKNVGYYCVESWPENDSGYVQIPQKC